MSRQTLYEWRRDPVFEAAFQDAQQEAVELLETAAFKRAKRGSDRLLIFLLKHLRPEVYGSRYVTPPSAAPAVVDSQINLSRRWRSKS